MKYHGMPNMESPRPALLIKCSEVTSVGICSFLCTVAWVDSGVWPDRDLHHQFPCGQDDVWTLRVGAQDFPEPQGEVHGEEHCSGQWVWQGAGCALQTCRRAPFPPCSLHRWTLPGGQCSLYELWDFCFYSSSVFALLHHKEQADHTNIFILTRYD